MTRRGKAQAKKKRPARGTSRRRVAMPPAGGNGEGGRLRRGWWALRGVLAALALVSLAAGAAFVAERVVRLPALAVHSIEVSGGEGVDREELIRASGVRLGEPLLKVDLEQVKERVSRHPRVREAVVVRQLPDRLLIEVTERTPRVSLLSGRFYTLDGEGVVLGLPDNPGGNHPLVTGLAGSWREGELVGEALPALRVLEGLLAGSPLEERMVSEVRLQPDGSVRVFLVGSGTVLVTDPRGVEGQAARLGRLMEAGYFDREAAGYDLRFEGRVVRLPGRELEERGV